MGYKLFGTEGDTHPPQSGGNTAMQGLYMSDGTEHVSIMDHMCKARIALFFQQSWKTN